MENIALRDTVYFDASITPITFQLLHRFYGEGLDVLLT